MERLIEAVASGIGNTIGFAAESGILFAAFALLWIAFGVALVWSQGSLDAAWAWVRSLPLVGQGFAWILFLPVMAGLWIVGSRAGRPSFACSSWAALRARNLLVFLPRALDSVVGSCHRRRQAVDASGLLLFNWPAADAVGA